MSYPLVIYATHSLFATDKLEQTIVRSKAAPDVVGILIFYSSDTEKYEIRSLRFQRNERECPNEAFDTLDALIAYINQIKDNLSYDIDLNAVVLCADINFTFCGGEPHMSLPFHRLVVETKATALPSFSNTPATCEQLMCYLRGEVVSVIESKQGDDAVYGSYTCPEHVISGRAFERATLRQGLLDEFEAPFLRIDIDGKISRDQFFLSDTTASSELTPYEQVQKQAQHEMQEENSVTRRLSVASSERVNFIQVANSQDLVVHTKKKINRFFGWGCCGGNTHQTHAGSYQGNTGGVNEERELDRLAFGDENVSKGM
jgi:hypothetical protein